MNKDVYIKFSSWDSAQNPAERAYSADLLAGGERLTASSSSTLIPPLSAFGLDLRPFGVRTTGVTP